MEPSDLLTHALSIPFNLRMFILPGRCRTGNHIPATSCRQVPRTAVRPPSFGQRPPAQLERGACSSQFLLAFFLRAQSERLVSALFSALPHGQVIDVRVPSARPTRALVIWIQRPAPVFIRWGGFIKSGAGWQRWAKFIQARLSRSQLRRRHWLIRRPSVFPTQGPAHLRKRQHRRESHRLGHMMAGASNANSGRACLPSETVV